MKKDYFKGMKKASKSMAGLSISTAVGAGVAAHAPAGTPSLTGGLNTLASFTPIMATAVSGKAVMQAMPKIKKHKWRYYMFDNPFRRDKEAAAEQRQMNFAREQSSIANSNSQEDLIYMQQNQSRPDLLKWQQDLNDIIDQKTCMLLGLYQTEEGVKQIGVPLCNRIFIDQVFIPLITDFYSRSFANSNMDSKTINMTLICTADEVCNILAHSGLGKFEIKFENFDIIMRHIKNAIKPAAWRAIHGWTKKTDSTNSKRVEHFLDSQEKSKGGIIKW